VKLQNINKSNIKIKRTLVITGCAFLWWCYKNKGEEGIEQTLWGDLAEMLDLFYVKQ